MNHVMATAVTALALTACAAPAAEAPARAAEAPVAAAQAAAVPKLELLWTTPGFDAPEGVAEAPGGGYFISNVAGEGEIKDGNGFISKLGPDGTITSMRWAEGLDAPKGMAVLGGALYIADIDKIVVLDAATGGRLREVPVEGAVFLNDVSVWQDEVVASDSGTGKIHRLDASGASVFMASSGYGGLNGLLGDGERLLMSTMDTGSLFAIGAAGQETVIATGMKNADGIGLVPGGGYLVSSWPGEIHHVGEDGVVTRLIDTQADGILQNDLSVFGDTVIVPNWLPGTVTSWKLVP